MFPKDQVIRLKGNDLKLLRIASYLRALGRCVRCGIQTYLDAPEWHPQKADMAHKRSRGAGGSDTIDNVENLCHRCHMKGHGGGKPCPSKTGGSDESIRDNH